ncbi:MAG: glycoside hydrolase family 13 protein [Clostridia bacterium]|nr:glycoside hydrolase family 13 protein [Clostridia bacterium]
MYIYYNPLDKACKSVTGAIMQAEEVRFNLFLLKEKREDHRVASPKSEDCVSPQQNAFLLLNRDGENAESFVMTKTAFGWSISLSVSEIGLYYYTFSIEGEGFVSCGYLETGYLSNTPKGFLLTVYSNDYKTPEWFKGGVMYQIFPDRFCKQGTMPDIKGRIAREDWGGIPSYKPNEFGKVLNNDFFGGNFKGIQIKLPYLQSLGVTTIYLNPIFEAASNHRYDTSDYKNIDPILGTEKDFSELVEAAKQKGIRIILDGVFNHTGDDSVYFNKYGRYDSVGAYQSKDSPYYSWYSFQEFPNKYASWWGIDILPEVNEKSEEYQNFIFGQGGVLKKWLGFGIGGYRLDVADELPDFFLKKLRKSVKESNNDAIIIGEVWEDASNKIAYSKRREYLQGYELDSVMNYPLKEAIIGYIQSGNAANLLQAVRVLINHYPKQTVDCLMNILGTHDTARILTVLGGIYCHNKDEMASKNAYLSTEAKQKAIEKLKMAAVLQYTLPGVPCIYYGDENGMEGHIDPFCRQCFDWERLNENLIEFYQKLGAIRKNYRVIFKDGEFEEILFDESLLVYKRAKDHEKIYAYCNNSSKRYILKISKCRELLTNTVYEHQMEIKPYSYGIFINE